MLPLLMMKTNWEDDVQKLWVPGQILPLIMHNFEKGFPFAQILNFNYASGTKRQSNT